MKLYFGTASNPMILVTSCKGYWNVADDGGKTFHAIPVDIERKVAYIYGISIAKIFVGAIIFGKAKSLPARRSDA